MTAREGDFNMKRTGKVGGNFGLNPSRRGLSPMQPLKDTTLRLPNGSCKNITN